MGNPFLPRGSNLIPLFVHGDPATTTSLFALSSRYPVIIPSSLAVRVKHCRSDVRNAYP
jgi:hypothetical protein